MSVQDTNVEKWVTIKDYPKYKISNLGRIWSEHTNKYIKPHLRSKDINAYMKVELFNEEGSKSMALHRLLAEAFIPNPDNKCCVNHKDGNKTNNHLANLEWVTYSENSQHATDTGLSPIGIERTSAKLSEQDVSEIASLLQSSDLSFNAIGNKYNIDSGVIRDIHRRRSWSHLTKDFIFADRSGHIKLSDDDVKKIAKLFLETTKNNKEIAEEFGVSDTVIGRIRRRQLHTDVTKDIEGDFFGKIDYAERPKPSNTLLTKDQVIEICERMSKEKPNFSAIARDYGLKHDDAIRMIYHRQTWNDVSKDYTFKETARMKVTEELVHKIVWYFINTTLENQEIADKVGVHKDVVRYLRNRKSWTKVTNRDYPDIDFKKNAGFHKANKGSFKKKDA